MDVSDAVWWIDQAMAKLEEAKRALTAMHYQSMADEAAAQNTRPRTEPAEASEVKVGECIVHNGQVRVVVGRDDWNDRVALVFEDDFIAYYDPNALVDLVVNEKLADEAATKAALQRCWSVLRKPDSFDDAQAAHLAAGLAHLGTEPRR